MEPTSASRPEKPHPAEGARAIALGLALGGFGSLAIVVGVSQASADDAKATTSVATTVPSTSTPTTSRSRSTTPTTATPTTTPTKHGSHTKSGGS